MINKEVKDMSTAELLVYRTHGKQEAFVIDVHQDRFPPEQEAWLTHGKKWIKEIEAELDKRGVSYK
jgi:hypothetical protein